jgi:hypothetical protein
MDEQAELVHPPDMPRDEAERWARSEPLLVRQRDPGQVTTASISLQLPSGATADLELELGEEDAVRLLVFVADLYRRVSPTAPLFPILELLGQLTPDPDATFSDGRRYG